MLVRTPLVEAEQDGSIRIHDLTKVVVGRRRLGLAEERLVPFEAGRNVPYADDRPCTFHCISAIRRTPQAQRWRPRGADVSGGFSHRVVACPKPTPALAAAGL